MYKLNQEWVGKTRFSPFEVIIKFNDDFSTESSTISKRIFFILALNDIHKCLCTKKKQCEWNFLFTKII